VAGRYVSEFEQFLWRRFFEKISAFILFKDNMKRNFSKTLDLSKTLTGPNITNLLVLFIPPCFLVQQLNQNLRNFETLKGIKYHQEILRLRPVITKQLL
jgi:Leucine-rich repeat (LRR) protein